MERKNSRNMKDVGTASIDTPSQSEWTHTANALIKTAAIRKWKNNGNLQEKESLLFRKVSENSNPYSKGLEKSIKKHRESPQRILIDAVKDSLDNMSASLRRLIEC